MTDRRQLGYVSATTNTFSIVQAPIVYGVATGGTSSNITVDGLPHRMLTFTGSGTLTVSTAGFFDCTIIGGGAAGKSSINGNGGGGGGGGAIVTSILAYFEAGTHTVAIGAGGLVYPPVAVTPSFVGKYASGKPQGPSDGGSANLNPSGPLVAGFSGGSGIGVGPNNGANGGGGGGGMGGAGANANTNRGYNNMVNGGNGGAGIDWSAWRGEAAGTTRYGGGGGGGGGYASNITAVGGSGGGGNGAQYYNSTGTNGGANTGGGGGGGSDNGAYTQGGSGLVLVRFKL
jgi:hypothetical protein